MKELQKGRSMIEMLGVLAIIGVLSIGGLAGYTMAMNRHRANQILDYVSRCAVAAQTKGDGYVIAGGSASTDTCGNLLPLETAPNGLAKASFKVWGADASSQHFIITTPTIKSQDIRTALLNRDNTNVTIREGDGAANGAMPTENTSTAGSETAKISFQFKK